MRRLLSIAMLLLLTLPLVAPALGQSAETHLMLCCRKDGVHHCTNPVPTDAPMVHGTCPAIPSASVTSHASGWMIGGTRLTSDSHAVEPLRVGQVEAGYRISFHRSRQKRGPPATRLS